MHRACNSSGRHRPCDGAIQPPLHRLHAGTRNGLRYPSGRSLRFLLFGELGAFVHFATLYIVLTVFQKPFAVAQGCGAVLARTSNFILNNFLTYRDQRLKGFAILRGLLLFYLVRGVGLAANVGVAFSVYAQEPIWWLAGVLMGVVWNYEMSGLFVWRK